MTGFWLAGNRRLAGIDRRGAMIAAALLALVLALSFTALLVPAPPPAARDANGRVEAQADVVLYETIVAGLRGGDDYYPVAARALRAGNYPLRPFITFRLPTLARLQAAVPDWLIWGVQLSLVAGVLAAWAARLWPSLTRMAPRIALIVLLFGGLMAFVQLDLAPFHEIWAGLLIALALAMYRPDRVLLTVSITLMAMLIRETSALFALIMFLAALTERRWREAAAWVGAVAVLAAAVAAHAHAVSMVVTPLDPVSPGWSGMLGPGHFFRTMGISTALTLAPVWLAAPVVALALFGWASWRSAMAVRALGTLVAYGLLLALFGRLDTFYWGLLVAPLVLPGLIFVPDALRDLTLALLDRQARRVQKSVA